MQTQLHCIIKGVKAYFPRLNLLTIKCKYFWLFRHLSMGVGEPLPAVTRNGNKAALKIILNMNYERTVDDRTFAIIVVCRTPHSTDVTITSTWICIALVQTLKFRRFFNDIFKLRWTKYKMLHVFFLFFCK